jgi:transcriptional pleiotropic regulator of transition state genes
LTCFGNIGILSSDKKMSNYDTFYKTDLFFSGGEFSMKSTGIVRKVDELGRVVIPIELRRTLDIAEKDALEIYVDNDRIILKKYKPNMTCQVTGEVSDDNLSLAEGKIILSPQGAKDILKDLQDYVSRTTQS